MSEALKKSMSLSLNDIVHKDLHLLKENTALPIAAYNVSGEFAMVKAACANGWLNYEQAMPEMLLSIKRAGADIILTYFAKDFAQLYKKIKG